jgi:hypothetical protein
VLSPSQPQSNSFTTVELGRYRINVPTEWPASTCVLCPIGHSLHLQPQPSVALDFQVLDGVRAALVGLKAAGQVVADNPAKAQKLRLEVGVFPIDDQCRLEAENPAHPKVLTALPPGPAIARQQVLSFDKGLGRSVDVLDYKAYPW